MNDELPFPEDEIVPFYNHEGRAVFYLYSDGQYFYHYDGTPLAYLHNNEYIVSFSGEYLGWVYNGWIIDYSDGSYAFFSPHASGGVSRPSRKSRPSRSSRRSRPSRSSRESRPSRPSRTTCWSEKSSEDYFPDY
ncbi:MAG: hypothetical protein JYX80_02230 [Candidatus Scalindua sediminis]|nr:hypothetical protein [Candidatus Scalindua sediminis]